MIPSHPNSQRPAPQVVLEALDVIASRWAEGGYADRYSDALLRHGGYVSADSRHEAAHVAEIMRSAYLSPFVLRGHLDSFAALARACEGDAEERGVFVLGSGNSGIPIILNALIGLVLGRTLYLRPSGANAPAIRVWLDALASAAPQVVAGSLGKAISLIDIPRADPGYPALLASLPVATAFLWGGGEALMATASYLRQVPPSRIHHFGPRTGVLVLDCSWWREQSSDDRARVAQACYDNIVMYDAGFCSSPTFGVMLGDMDECRRVLEELVSFIVPEAHEQERLARLTAAAARRRQMRQWTAHGYSLHRPRGSSAVLALATLAHCRRKNYYLPPADTFHDSAASLELLAFPRHALRDVAALLAGLHREPRYRGNLWSIGHVITGADSKTASALRCELAPVLATGSDGRVLGSEALRFADVRANFGRRPGEDFDGVSLLNSMLPQRGARCEFF